MSTKSGPEKTKKETYFTILFGSYWVFGLICLSFFNPIQSQDAKSKTSKTVSLVIDYSDGAEKRLTGIAWRNGMNVMDVMNHAQKHPHGIKFEHRGKGATAFIKQIDDLKNQGSRGKNWVFRVNKKLGDRSFAIYQLNPADTVLWKFDTYP